MSVNLKGRKNAQSEQPAPAPELVMAGGQTPWSSELPPSGNPFSEAGAPEGLPTMPPPPPPFAPGEEADAEAPAAGRKAPSRNLVIAAVAVLVLGGGGYFYLNSGGSTAATPAAHAAPKPKVGGVVGKTGVGAPKPVVGKPVGKTGVGAPKPVVGKPVVGKPVGKTAVGAPKPVPGKVVAPGSKVAASGKTTTPAKAATAATPAFHAALPGRIGGWSKLASAKLPPSLAKYDSDLGTSPSNVQTGTFGGTAANPYLYIITGDHSAETSKKAKQIVDLIAQDARDDAAATLKALAPNVNFANPIVYPGATAVPTAPYAGTAACTTVAVVDSSEVICAWMDTNTFGIIVVPNQVDSTSGVILAMVRGSVES